VSCAKTAEPIEMQFRNAESGGPREHVLDGNVDDPHAGIDTFGVSFRLKSIRSGTLSRILSGTRRSVQTVSDGY